DRGLDKVDYQVRQFLEASRSANTLRAYESDLAHYVANAGAVPTDPMTIARYLAQLAGDLAIATLMRRLVAIGQAHTNDLVRLTAPGDMRWQSHRGDDASAKPVPMGDPWRRLR